MLRETLAQSKFCPIRHPNRHMTSWKIFKQIQKTKPFSMGWLRSSKDRFLNQIAGSHEWVFNLSFAGVSHEKTGLKNYKVGRRFSSPPFRFRVMHSDLLTAIRSINQSNSKFKRRPPDIKILNLLYRFSCYSFKFTRSRFQRSIFKTISPSFSHCPRTIFCLWVTVLTLGIMGLCNRGGAYLEKSKQISSFQIDS